jgi:hypothetical protein
LAGCKSTQLTPKTASLVLPEDGCLTPETCTGSRHNEVIVKVKVYYVGYVIVILSVIVMKILRGHYASIRIVEGISSYAGLEC